ncbi:hypothetical protein [Heyndrickxia sporothermodurans]|uniref:hypothetical protein n=1 Tax=Heyndrickxia sporothermodurans TaxID=46224 RepID=UPI002E1A2726|nr:hypothetical protein [Heyndrickxia sporothermodurans]MED3697929.1 hypothetical protein [Heyndrickxia sporothermodurans]
MLIEITTHDGVTRKTTVETYDPVAINESINNGELLTVVIGDLIISRINVKEVMPVEVTEVV